MIHMEKEVNVVDVIHVEVSDILMLLVFWGTETLNARMRRLLSSLFPSGLLNVEEENVVKTDFFYDSEFS